MGMTIAEKILARKNGQAKVGPGDLVTVTVEVDTVILFDNNFMTNRWREILKVKDPDRLRFIVTPGSQTIYREALKLGVIAQLLDAGAVVTPATCGACGGGHLGILGPNETCITATTRNFKGRMGDPSARIFLGSPATVAASAITGVITDPRELLN